MAPKLILSVYPKFYFFMHSYFYLFYDNHTQCSALAPAYLTFHTCLPTLPPTLTLLVTLYLSYHNFSIHPGRLQYGFLLLPNSFHSFYAVSHTVTRNYLHIMLLSVACRLIDCQTTPWSRSQCPCLFS